MKASEKGHVGTVEALLTHPSIDVNKPNKVIGWDCSGYSTVLNVC